MPMENGADNRDGEEPTPARKLEQERERIERRQPHGKHWKGYRPGDKMPLTKKNDLTRK